VDFADMSFIKEKLMRAVLLNDYTEEKGDIVRIGKFIPNEETMSYAKSESRPRQNRGAFHGHSKSHREKKLHVPGAPCGAGG